MLTLCFYCPSSDRLLTHTYTHACAHAFIQTDKSIRVISLVIRSSILPRVLFSPTVSVSLFYLQARMRESEEILRDEHICLHAWTKTNTPIIILEKQQFILLWILIDVTIDRGRKKNVLVLHYPSLANVFE